MGEEKEKF